MAKQVAAVWVPVTDMKRATAFYRDVLGLAVTMESDDGTELDAGGLTIGLNGRETAETADHGGAVISFHPETSIEQALDDLEQRGGHVQGAISEHSWGRIFPFRDTEGNDLQFYTPPAS